MGFLFEFFRIFELIMVVVKGREGSCQLEAFFHSINTSYITSVLFLLLPIALDFSSLLGLLLRLRYYF